jgi:hypothetical protein
VGLRSFRPGHLASARIRTGLGLGGRRRGRTLVRAHGRGRASVVDDLRPSGGRSSAAHSSHGRLPQMDDESCRPSSNPCWDRDGHHACSSRLGTVLGCSSHTQYAPLASTRISRDAEDSTLLTEKSAGGGVDARARAPRAGRAPSPTSPSSPAALVTPSLRDELLERRGYVSETGRQ